MVCAGDDNSHHQVGIVSWGLGCKKVEVPGTYTNICSLKYKFNFWPREYKQKYRKKWEEQYCGMLAWV